MHLFLTKNNKLTDTFLFLTAGTLFVWGIVASAISCTEFSPNYKLLLLHTFLIMLLFRFITINKYILITFLVIIAMTCAFILYDMRTSSYLLELYDKAKHSITMIMRYFTGFETYKPEYETIITWAFLVVTSLFATLFVLHSFHFFILLIVSVITMGACLFSRNLSYNLSFFACMGSLFIFLIKYLNNRNINNDTKVSQLLNNKKIGNLITICSIPAVFICFVIAYYLPTPHNKAVEQTFNSAIKKPFDDVSNYLYPYFSSKYYSLKNTGFINKNNRLGGNITLNNRIVMEVAMSENLSEKLYLAGSYRDKYTGYSWENTEPIYEPYELKDNSSSVDFLELSFSNLMVSLDNGEFDIFATILENPELIKNSNYKDRCEFIPNGTFTIEMQLSVYKPKTAVITMKDAKTYSVFSPLLMTSIENSANTMQLKKRKTGDVISNELINTNEPYSISYRTRAAIPYWEIILKCSRTGIYSEIYEKLVSLHEKYDLDKNQISVNLDEQLDKDPRNLHMLNIYPEGEDYFDPDKSICYEDLLVNTLIPRAKEIYERYTVLPEHLPKRVIKLAEDITAVSEGPYMKANVIRNFLKNFPYTLSPGEIPDNRDFVDYFLFDSQKGYCVYYASAFVIMCRAVGIPARYVEGYVTPTAKSENGTYIVTNEQAHAWAEIYLEGYGWLTYDPTSSITYNEEEAKTFTLNENYPADSDIIIEFKEIEALEADMSKELISKEEISEEMISILKGTVSKEVLRKGIKTPSTLPLLMNQYQDSRFIYLKSKKTAVNEISKDLIIYRLLSSILVLVFISITTIGIRYYVKKVAVTKKIKIGSNEAVMQYFLMLVNYLGLYGYKQYEQETSMEFASRIKNEPRLCDNHIHFYTITEIFSKAYYGGKQISEEDKSILENALYNIEKLMLHEFGKMKYIYFKFIKI